jgi:acetyl-CoA C-acetyltransferase
VPDSTTPVILSACRTPVGKYLGGLASLTAPQLGAIVIREAVRRAGVEAAAIDDVIMGHVLQGGAGQASGRQAMIHAGLPGTIPAVTINKVCGSGLKAVMLAAQSIKAGDAQCVVAGGMEAMSASPHYVFGMRGGIRSGNQTLVDGMIHDGLWDSFGGVHMGSYAEYTAKKTGITRQEQDEFALQSHRRAVAAMEACRFQAETVPVEVQGKGGTTRIEKDEGPRRDTTLEALARLKPAFEKGGTVTAGNAPPVNDGAAALVVMSADRAARMNVKPMARIVGQAASGLAPKYVLMTPVEAVRRVLKKTGWRLEDVDLVELNEAFSVQAVAVLRDLGLDAAKVNVNGGAVALGHPIGASGARVLTTLLYALEARGLRRGIATLCLGGGNGVALAIERA